MVYAVNAYNNCIVKNFNHTPFEIINGHTASTPTNRIKNRPCIDTDQILQYKETIEKFFDKIHYITAENKDKYIGKINEKRHDPLDYEGQPVYKKTTMRSKTLPKYSALDIDPQIKQDNIIKVKSKQDSYSKNTVKRPKKKFNKKPLLQVSAEPSTSKDTL